MFDPVHKRKSFLSTQEAKPSPAVDYDELPAVSALLAGIATEDGKTLLSPAYTLMLWAEGEWLKFCFTAGEYEPKCWGSFQGLSTGLYGVEKALQDDKCDWRKPKADRNPLTHGNTNGRR